MSRYPGLYTPTHTHLFPRKYGILNTHTHWHSKPFLKVIFTNIISPSRPSPSVRVSLSWWILKSDRINSNIFFFQFRHLSYYTVANFISPFGDIRHTQCIMHVHTQQICAFMMHACEVAPISSLLWEDRFTFWMVYVSSSTWCIMNFHLCVFSFKNILWLFNIEHSDFVFMTEWKWYSDDQTLTLVPGWSRDEYVVFWLLREIEREIQREMQ